MTAYLGAGLTNRSGSSMLVPEGSIMMLHSVAVRLTIGAALLTVTTAQAQDSGKSKAQPETLQTRVWVNNNTRVYHCPGNQYYGRSARTFPN